MSSTPGIIRKKISLYTKKSPDWSGIKYRNREQKNKSNRKEEFTIHKKWIVSEKKKMKLV